jgi:N utilization substance protein B
VKNKLDPRHQKRIKTMQSLFAWQLGNHHPRTKTSLEIIKNIDTVDQNIRENAPKWPLDKINHVDLAILRLATWELLFSQSLPKKVVADEAIEIAKEYSSESSPAFINGVIGSIIKKLSTQNDSS